MQLPVTILLATALLASAPSLGQPIETRLTNQHLPGTPDEPGVEVNFDDLRLDRFCAADFNDSGGVSVQDLFDSLATCFGAGC